MRAGGERAFVTVADTAVTIKQPGRTALIVANVLGMYRDADGQPQRIWLDRLVHQSHIDYGEWSASGAVVTELKRV